MMRTAVGLLACIGLGVASCAAPTVAQPCAITPFAFSRVDSVLRVGGHVVRFDNPDAPAPTAWEGPVVILDAAGTRRCSVATEGLIAGPLVVHDGRHLVLATFSGSNHQVETIDLARCARFYVSDRLAGPLTVRDGVPLAAGRPVPGFRCALTP